MKRIIIYRRDFSSYFSADFAQQEKSLINQMIPAGSEFYYCTEAPLNNWRSAADELIILTNSQSDFKAFAPDLLDKTSLLIHANSGYDNISAEFVKKAKFPLVIGNEIRAEAVATYVLSCLFDHEANVPFCSQWDNKRSWPRRLISELKILILGHGHIAQICTQVLRTLGATIEVYDPFQGMNDLNLSQADVIIPLASLNSTSKHLMNREFFSQLKENVLIINGARGGLIDEAQLLSYLKTHPQAFAYLDVFEKEPFDASQFKDYQNLKLSSHVAGVYQNLDRELIKYELKVLKSFWQDAANFKQQYAAAILNNRLHGDELI